MPPSISFLVDECLPKDVANAFRSAGYSVRWVKESPWRGAPDSELWKVAAQQSQVFVTRDLDFPLTAAERPLGLVLFRVPDWYRRAHFAELTREFLSGLSPAALVGRVTVISPGRPLRTHDLESQ